MGCTVVTRGTPSPVGAERVAPNGYWYRKTEDRGWQLVHRLVAEEKLGRQLTENEFATFSDGDKQNFDPDNIIVQLRGKASLRKRLAQVEARIDELTATRDELKARLELQESLDYSQAES